MSILIGLHGTAALLLLCSLLFMEEAGVPLPLLPGDAILVVGGLFIARGSLSPWIFIPCASLATLGGAIVAHSWARAIGMRGLSAVANRVHAARQLERATRRVQSTGPLGIAVCRLLPGLRVYTTLISGAVGINLRVFLVGAVPAVIVWVAVFTVLGIVVGVPVEHALSRAERIATEGIALIAIGTTAFFGIRHIPAAERAGAALYTTRRSIRLILAACMDVGVIATVVSGLAELTEDLAGFPDIDGLIDISFVIVAIALFYIAASRRGAGGTAGEALLNVSYRARAGTP